jgi:hypothetical protein
MTPTTTPIHKTAFGKTVLHTLLVVLAYALTYAVTYFGKIHWPNSMPVYLPGFLLVGVVGLRNFVDKELPNFPTSTQLVAIPKEVAVALHIIDVANTEVLPEVDKLLPANPTTSKLEADANKVATEAATVAKTVSSVVGQPSTTVTQTSTPSLPGVTTPEAGTKA